jgi:hypothetical protein
MSKPITFEWAPRSNISVDAQEAYVEIERIRKKYVDPTAEDFLREFSRKKSILHDELQWDDAAAANSHRTDQVRTILRSLYVSYSEAPNIKTRAFVVIETEDVKPATGRPVKVYSSKEDALVDPAMRSQLLDRALRELKSWRREYANLKELTDIFNVIDKVA